ncbi:MAG: hypothetical protein ACTHKU_06090 [Verrucomicrobiota bacterium]
MKYYEKDSAEFEKRPVFEAVQTKKNKTIDTRYGDVLVVEGNYIVTDPDGNKYGMDASDFERQFEPVESTDE